VFVKICGITSRADAEVAVAAGADAIGIVCAPSPRQVAPEAIAGIVGGLPPGVMSFGVFRNEVPGRVVEIVQEAGLSGAQLHGDEPAEEVAWVAERVGCVIKAVPWRSGAWTPEVGPEVWAVLVDGVRPGSGEMPDWDRLTLPRDSRAIIAGGLRPENVAEAIERFRPFGVDVASGVERSPGRKDVERVVAFVGNARRTAARLDALAEVREERER
jgi:phosphoribosylanthranilate isomerase